MMMTIKNNPSTVSGTYLDALSASFKPASGISQATHWLTTSEVYEAIRQINPGTSITKEQVHQAMLDAGYCYRNRPGSSDLDFRWMLTTK